jgi:hypothetical protein
VALHAKRRQFSIRRQPDVLPDSARAANLVVTPLVVAEPDLVFACLDWEVRAAATVDRAEAGALLTILVEAALRHFAMAVVVR